MSTTIRLDISGAMADAVGAEHGITAAEWEGVTSAVAAAQEKLLARKLKGQLGFAELPYDQSLTATINPLAQQIRYRFNHLLVLGIGGSALGLRSMQDALLSPSVLAGEHLHLRSVPKLHVCDNIDPDTFAPLLQQIDLKQTLVNVISKSGKTAEVGAQFLIVRELLEKRFGSQKWKEHVVVTTDPASGPMRAMVICEGLQSFPIAPNVGGRFSALSAVGLFPAACAGIDIDAVQRGARACAEACFADRGMHTVAAQLAALHFLLDTRHGKSIAVLMPYRDALQRFTDWYVQLHAESLGKGGLGQTPLRAVGATDQHSQLQLFMDGPNNKMLTLLTTERANAPLIIPHTDEPVFAFMGGKDLFTLLQTEARATRQSLQEAARPTIELSLPQLDAATFGELLFCYEWTIALLGELYNLNAFDQPAVERGKILTKQLLM